MSGALNNIYNNTSFALRLHAEAMARLQEQVSTGSRINRASDDPSTAYRILGLTSQERSLENYMDNLSDAVSKLEFAYEAIRDMIGAIAGATGAMSAISGIDGGAAQRVAIEAIDSELERMVLAANTNYNGQYLFGGSNITSAPYVTQRDSNGKIISVTYQGSLEDLNAEIAPGVESSAFHVGENLFRSNNRSDPVFPSSNGTGAENGTGTSSVKGDVWLTVTGSAGNYDLSIDGGLSSFNTDGTDTNLAVTDSRTGEVLYVDTTGITSTGVDWIRVPGTYDVFSTLIAIRDRLESGGDVQELRDNALQSLEEMKILLTQKSVSVGAKSGSLSNLRDNLESMKWDTEDEVARLEEADIAQIAIDLSRREVLYQMSLALTGRIMSMSLLNFIR